MNVEGTDLMLARRRTALAAALCAAFSLLAGPSQAAQAVALILDLTDAGSTDRQPFTELGANDSVELGANGKITLMHYGTCEEVVAQGGTLVVTERQYLTRQGKIVSVTRAKCPKKVSLAGEARTGGVRLRAGNAGLKLGTVPSFVVIGPGRSQVTEVAVLHDGKEVARHKLSGPKFRWPEDAAPLAPGRDYALAFSRQNGSTGEPIAFEVREGEQGMVLVEVD